MDLKESVMQRVRKEGERRMTQREGKWKEKNRKNNLGGIETNESEEKYRCQHHSP